MHRTTGLSPFFETNQKSSSEIDKLLDCIWDPDFTHNFKKPETVKTRDSNKKSGKKRCFISFGVDRTILVQTNALPLIQLPYVVDLKTLIFYDRETEKEPEKCQKILNVLYIIMILQYRLCFRALCSRVVYVEFIQRWEVQKKYLKMITRFRHAITTTVCVWLQS